MLNHFLKPGRLLHLMFEMHVAARSMRVIKKISKYEPGWFPAKAPRDECQGMMLEGFIILLSPETHLSKSTRCWPSGRGE